MPQAKPKNITIPRRKGRSAQTIPDDPIFALIADFRAKAEALVSVRKAQKQLENKLDADADHQTKAEKRLLSNASPPLYIGHAWDIHSTGKELKNYVHFRLRDATAQFGPKTQRKIMALEAFARKEIEQMFHAFQAEHKRKRDAAGLTALDERVTAASAERRAAARRMVCTTPRTPAGASALAEAIVGMSGKMLWDECEAERGVRALARAVAIAARKH